MKLIKVLSLVSLLATTSHLCKAVGNEDKDQAGGHLAVATPAAALSLLYKFPCSFQNDIIQDWLSGGCLGKLETASTNKAARKTSIFTGAAANNTIYWKRLWESKAKLCKYFITLADGASLEEVKKTLGKHLLKVTVNFSDDQNNKILDLIGKGIIEENELVAYEHPLLGLVYENLISEWERNQSAMEPYREDVSISLHSAVEDLRLNKKPIWVLADHIACTNVMTL